MRTLILPDRQTVRALGGAFLALTIVLWMIGTTPAWAGGRDSDGDGMPNAWESAQGLNPLRANASGDPDHDHLSNLGEYRHHADPRDEDADNDGTDDGDEVNVFDTEPDDRDSDDDGVRDGDEDSDEDGVEDEDEDDFTESCRADDDDRDDDGVDDEDENELGLSLHHADSDDDGVEDGNEDHDGDDVDVEDEDDDADDRCESDEADEDADDQIGTIASFDSDTGNLVVDLLHGGQLSGVVTADTELEWDSSGEGNEGDATTADLVQGTSLTEVEFDEDTGALEEVTLLAP